MDQANNGTNQEPKRVGTNPEVEVLCVSAGTKLLTFLKTNSMGTDTQPPLPSSLEIPGVMSISDLEAGAQFAPLKYKAPNSGDRPSESFEMIDELILVHRLVTIIRSSGNEGITLTSLGTAYRSKHPPLAKHWKFSAVLPPSNFHPHLVSKRLPNGELKFSFTSVAQAAPAVIPPSPPQTRPEKRILPSPSRPNVAGPVVVIKEPAGMPRCGQLLGVGGKFVFEMTGLSMRNAAQLSSLIQKSLLFVLDASGVRHGGRSGNSGAHLALINASLLLQPKENCCIWFRGKETSLNDVVDVAASIEGAWGPPVASERADSNPEPPMFSKEKRGQWSSEAKRVWVLFSLPSRRLVVQQDRRLLLIATPGPGRPCNLIGAANGSWHFGPGSAKEVEVSDEAVAQCQAAGMLPKLDPSDSSLYCEVLQSSKAGPVPTAGNSVTKPTNAFSAFDSDSSSDEEG